MFQQKQLQINKEAKLYSCFIKTLGINLNNSHKLLISIGWDLNTSINLISLKKQYQIFVLLELLYNVYIKNFKLKLVKFELLKFQKCYRGFRIMCNLPLRGQNTHNNHNTRRRFNIF